MRAETRCKSPGLLKGVDLAKRSRSFSSTNCERASARLNGASLSRPAAYLEMARSGALKHQATQPFAQRRRGEQAPPLRKRLAFDAAIAQAPPVQVADADSEQRPVRLNSVRNRQVAGQADDLPPPALAAGAGGQHGVRLGDVILRRVRKRRRAFGGRRTAAPMRVSRRGAFCCAYFHEVASYPTWIQPDGVVFNKSGNFSFNKHSTLFAVFLSTITTAQ